MKYTQFLKDHWVQTSALVMAAVLLIGVGRFASAQSYSALSTTLGVGSRGSDVTMLQTFLASNPKVYPQGLVTGYFGPLTEAAVRNFQIGYAIEPVGRVGPITLGRMNSLITAHQAIDVASPVQSNVTVNSLTITGTTAVVSWSTDELATGKVIFSSVPITGSDAAMSRMEPALNGSVVADNGSNSTKSIQLTGLSPNTTYYYMVESIDMSGNVSVSPQGTFKTAM